MSLGPEPFEIDIATTADLPEILQIANSKYGKPYNQDSYWKWRYFANRVAQVRLYVVRSRNRKIAAMQGVSKYSMWIDCERRPVHLLTAAFTLPEHRRKGLFRSLINKIIADVSSQESEFLFTFPNPLSSKGFREFAGWKEDQVLSLYVRPLSVLSGWRKLSGQTIPEVRVGPTSGLRITAQTEFSVGASEMLDDSSSGISFVDRSRDYLNWRYNELVPVKYEVLQAHNGSTFRGYTVLKPAIVKGTRVALVIDLIAADDITAGELLWASIDSSRRKGLRGLAFLVGRTNPYLKPLAKYGFVKWPSLLMPRQFPVFAYRSETGRRGHSGATKISNWYLTWGDTDVA